MQFKHKGQASEIQGIVFTINGYSKIDIALNRDNYVERQMQSQP